MDSASKILRLLRTPVTLVLLLCVVGYGAKWGYDKATEEIPPRPPTPCTMFDVGGELTPRWVTARVFNGGTEGGQARQTGLQLRAFGFTVIKINNTEERITNTVIVGNSAEDPEVQLLLNFFEGATARGDGRVDHVVDVLIGNETVRITNPKVTSVKVDGKVCLPADTKVPTPSPSPTPSTKE